MNSKASGHVPRIGILSPATEPGMRDWWKEFTQGLNELGYEEGSNIEIVWRFADGKFEHLPALATELIGLGVNVIMPATPPAIRAAVHDWPLFAKSFQKSHRVSARFR